MATESPLLKLLGPSLLSKVGTKVSTVDALKGKDLVLLYFSAFSPLLIQFYNKCAKEGKLEVIFVSSDKTIDSFEEYYGKMPWLAIPADGTAIKNSLAQTFQLSSIPTSLVLDCKTGEYITDDARNTVAEVANGTKEQGLKLIANWNQMESVPVEEAGAKRKAELPKQHPLLAVVMYIAKNPMYIFGLIYIYKYLKKTYFPSAMMMEEEPEEAMPDQAANEGEF